MEKAGFDLASWSHWLLIICFVGVSVWGLMLSWQWGEKNRTRRQRNKHIRAQRRQIELSHRLAIGSSVSIDSQSEIGRQNANSLHLKALQLSNEEDN